MTEDQDDDKTSAEQYFHYGIYCGIGLGVLTAGFLYLINILEQSIK